MVLWNLHFVSHKILWVNHHSLYRYDSDIGVVKGISVRHRCRIDAPQSLRPGL